MGQQQQLGGTFTQPTSATAFATFAGQVAARYGPMGVHAYEIWNEPNTRAVLVADPESELLHLHAQGLLRRHQGGRSPRSTVISGGLSPATTDGTDYSPIDFLTDMYADGAAGSFDALGFHPYSYPALPDT